MVAIGSFVEVGIEIVVSWYGGCDYYQPAQLLEGIGAISKVDSKKAVAHSGNYQDNVAIPLACERDNNTPVSDELNRGSMVTDLDIGAEVAGVLSEIEKVDNLPLPTTFAN